MKPYTVEAVSPGVAYVRFAFGVSMLIDAPLDRVIPLCSGCDKPLREALTRGACFKCGIPATMPTPALFSPSNTSADAHLTEWLTQATDGPHPLESILIASEISTLFRKCVQSHSLSVRRQAARATRRTRKKDRHGGVTYASSLTTPRDFIRGEDGRLRSRRPWEK